MKKLLFISLCLLLGGFSAQAQECEDTCDGQYELGAGGTVYYPAVERKFGSYGLDSYTIEGAVTDGDGIAIDGVMVYVLRPDTVNAQVGDANGEFTIEVTNENKSTILQFLKLGKQSVMAVVGPEHHEKRLHVVMKNEVADLGSRLRDVISKPKEEEVGKSFYIRKPAIYLYPEERSNVSVKHHFKGEILNTYPAYGDGWEVIAEPSGKLYNVKDKRNYSYLFWDGMYSFPASHYNYKEGFYVKADDYVSFLLEKLEKIGLNETEINDFIVYWLPALSDYEESFIHFRINDDIGNSSRLDVSPKPDTMIRVFMEFREHHGGEQKLPEQNLPTIARKKFTLVEWGGGEIASDMVQ